MDPSALKKNKIVVQQSSCSLMNFLRSSFHHKNVRKGKKSRKKSQILLITFNISRKILMRKI